MPHRGRAIPASPRGRPIPSPSLSSPAEAIREPSGLNATLVTAPVCPLSVSVSWPVAGSHTFTVWSWLAEAIREPSGLNATLETGPVCPLSVRVSLPVSRVPNLHRLVVAGGGELGAVGAERHAVTPTVCPLRVSVPDPSPRPTPSPPVDAGGGDP